MAAMPAVPGLTGPDSMSVTSRSRTLADARARRRIDDEWIRVDPGLALVTGEPPAPRLPCTTKCARADGLRGDARHSDLAGRLAGDRDDPRTRRGQ